MERRHVLGAMYSLGQVVVVSAGDAPQVGEVVGVRAASLGTLYDVSLEHVVVKAVAQDAVRAATVDELNSLLTSLMGATGGMSSERDALLRQEYVSTLVRARASLEQESSLADALPTARYAVGEYVVLQEGDTSSLGRVMGVSMRNQELCYTLEVMGETLRADEASLHELEGAAADGIALGARARFVAPGYEDDDAFLGLVCSRAQDADGPVFAILFDDGDVLEGLRPTDLERLPD